MSIKELKDFLDGKVSLYNNPSFIQEDPVSIPHQFSSKEDIEIIGLWTAILSWGQRKTIINKAKELCNYMDHAPYDFIMNHTDKDLDRISNFKHRTFNDADTLCMISFFKWYYQRYDSLQDAFAQYDGNELSIKKGIAHFYDLFCSAPDFLDRTKKHISSPLKKSACKRINMFLRWMVRDDDQGVDFGLWKNISPSRLMIPLDVHVYRIATKLGLLSRKAMDWQTVEELTHQLRILDPEDPVRYDFALFGIGVMEKDILT